MSQRVLVFDAVGTLIRPARSISQTYFEFGQQFDSQKTQAEIKSQFSQLFHSLFRTRLPTNEETERSNWRHLIQTLFDDISNTEPLFQALWNYFSMPSSWQLFDDVKPVWPAIQNTQSVIAIASNFDARLRPILSAIAPLDQIQHLFISSEIGHPKPSSQFFDNIEFTLSESDNFTMIGDDPICDIAPAESRGWQTVLIDRQAPQESKSAINSLLQLPSTLHRSKS